MRPIPRMMVLATTTGDWHQASNRMKAATGREAIGTGMGPGVRT